MNQNSNPQRNGNGETQRRCVERGYTLCIPTTLFHKLPPQTAILYAYLCDATDRELNNIRCDTAHGYHVEEEIFYLAEDGWFFIGVDQIKRAINMNPDTQARHLKTLQEHGLIKVRRIGVGGRRAIYITTQDELNAAGINIQRP